MVTGGSGLVGSGIRMYVEQSDARPEEEWVYLSSSDGDLRDRKATEAIFEKYKPTHVIHLAAKVGGLFANMSQKVWNLLKKECKLDRVYCHPPPLVIDAWHIANSNACPFMHSLIPIFTPRIDFGTAHVSNKWFNYHLSRRISFAITNCAILSLYIRSNSFAKTFSLTTILWNVAASTKSKSLSPCFQPASSLTRLPTPLTKPCCTMVHHIPVTRDTRMPSV